MPDNERKVVHHTKIEEAFEMLREGEEALFNLLEGLRNNVIPNYLDCWNDPYAEKMLNDITEQYKGLVEALDWVEQHDRGLCMSMNDLLEGEGKERVYDESSSMREKAGGGPITRMSSPMFNYEHDFDCEYDQLDGYADELLSITSGNVGPDQVRAAAGRILRSGNWGGRDRYLADLRNLAKKAEGHITKLNEYGQQTKRIVELMRGADAQVKTL